MVPGASISVHCLLERAMIDHPNRPRDSNQFARSIGHTCPRGPDSPGRLPRVVVPSTRGGLSESLFRFWLRWLVSGKISVRTSCASFASLSSRRRSMFIRTSAAFLSISPKIAGRSPGARRCLFALAPSGGGSPLPMGLFVHSWLQLFDPRGALIGPALTPPVQTSGPSR